MERRNNVNDSVAQQRAYAKEYHLHQLHMRTYL